MEKFQIDPALSMDTAAVAETPLLETDTLDEMKRQLRALFGADVEFEEGD